MERELFIGLRAITTGIAVQFAAKCGISILKHLHDLYKDIFSIQ
jgi:hypothetical protein